MYWKEAQKKYFQEKINLTKIIFKNKVKFI